MYTGLGVSLVSLNIQVIILYHFHQVSDERPHEASGSICCGDLVIIPPLPEGGGGILFYLCPSQDIFLSNC